ncbi:hypothetical protein [Salinisphaera sp. G21_0]|uniref:hypothetical protein n=1 Tax=Salinisphaera sp. G21_0 TaxID=2821094 RepID=UPI001ADCF4B7|nr:hypothetical protein [Salinisphaera sp. G21_0]MBO9480945.1 hypothetical protein [Salinisphaera sp. G21_0]
MKSNTANNTQQTVYLGDPSRIRGGRPASVFNRIGQLINPMNWFSQRVGSNRYSDYQKASSNLVKSLNNYHEIKLAASKVLYLTTGNHREDIGHKIQEELNSMKPAIYRRLEDHDPTCSISTTDIKPKQEITMTDQELETMLDNNTSILSRFEELITIIENRKSLSPSSSDSKQAQASTGKLADNITTAINELALTCMKTSETNKQNLHYQLAVKETIIMNGVLIRNPELNTIDNYINQRIKNSCIPEEYRQIAHLNISWNILLHTLGLDTELLAVRFSELDNIKYLIFHSMNASSIKEGKDCGISRFFTRFMSQEDGDINNPARAERVKEIMALETSIASGKLQPILLDGIKLAEPVETSSVDFTSSAILRSNEIYNFRRAILYPAYKCHKAQLEGKPQEEKDCLHILTLSCLAYFFRIMRAEWSEGLTSHVNAAIRIIEFIQSIKSDRLSSLSGRKEYPFKNLEQLNEHFSGFYHKYCT